MEKWGIKFGKFVSKVKPVDLLKTWRIFQGDLVQVISGRYRGQQGKVLKVQRDRNAVIIEGVNLVKRHVGSKLSGSDKGSIITLEQSISISNVALVDPTQRLPTKTKWAWKEDVKDESIRKIRISKLTGEEIPKPAPPVRVRKTGPFDTIPSVALTKTFKADLSKFPIPEDCIL